MLRWLVGGRLQRERDEARAALEQFQASGPRETMNGKRAVSEEAAGVPAKRVGPLSPIRDIGTACMSFMQK